MKFFSESGGKNGVGLRFRFLPSAKKKKVSALGASRSCREKNGKTVLPMYSDFFSHTTGRRMVTDPDMEGLTVGSRRFISANRRRMTQELKKRFAGAFLLFLAGIILTHLSLTIGWFASHKAAGYVSDILTELSFR